MTSTTLPPCPDRARPGRARRAAHAPATRWSRPFYTSPAVFDARRRGGPRAHLAVRRHRGGGPRARRLRDRRARAVLRDRAARRRRGGAGAAQRLPPPGRAHPRRAGRLGRQHRVRLPPLDLRHRRLAAARRRPARRLRQELLRPQAGARPGGRRAGVRLPRRRAAGRLRRGGRHRVAVPAAAPAAPHQGRGAGRPGRGGQLEAGDGEQPGVLPLRGRPPRADLHLLPDLRLRRGPDPGPAAARARALPARRGRARAGLRGARAALPRRRGPPRPGVGLPGAARGARRRRRVLHARRPLRVADGCSATSTARGWAGSRCTRSPTRGSTSSPTTP